MTAFLPLNANLNTYKFLLSVASLQTADTDLMMAEGKLLCHSWDAEENINMNRVIMGHMGTVGGFYK